MTDFSGNGTQGTAPEAVQGGASLSVNAQYIKDLSFESPNMIRILTQPPAGAAAPEVSFNLNVQANGIGPDAYEVVLSVRAEAKREGLVMFIVELAYAGIFTVTGIPQEQLEPVLFVDAPTLLFPFARSVVADVTRDGGASPLMLPLINFIDLYRRRVAERQAEASQAPIGMPN